MKKVNTFNVLSLLTVMLVAILCFSCTKTEVENSQNTIADPTVPDWTEDELKPREGEVTVDGEPVVMVFGATVDYTPKPQEPVETADEEDEASVEESAESSEPGGPVDEEEGSKSHLGDLVDTGSSKYYPNLWSVGDCVSINGESSAPLQASSITNEGKRARFPMAKWVEKYGDHYYVGYPADAFDFSEGTGTVTLPSTQVYSSTTYDPDAFIMVGKSTEEAIKFYPQVVPVKIRIPGTYSSTISKVRIESVDGEALSGTFSTDYNNEDASFEATSGNSYVEMTTPDIAFGSEVFFVLPVRTYAHGLRIRVTTADAKEMVFSKSSPITLEVGQMLSLASPSYAPSATSLDAPTLGEITPSTLSVQWASATYNNDYGKRWNILVYDKARCSDSDLVRDYLIYAEAGCWSKNQSPLIYAVGRLTPGATYYVKVADLGNDIVSGVSSFTLSSAPATKTMPASNITEPGVILTEDFSEVGWGSSYYSEVGIGGSYPTPSKGANNISQRTFDKLYTTDNTTFLPSGTEWGFHLDRFNTAFSKSRMAQWYYYGRAYLKPGYIKLGTMDGSGHLLTSPIPLAEGKTAIVNVTVKAAKYSDASANTWAIAVIKGATPAGASDHAARAAASPLPWPEDTDDATLYQTVTIDTKTWKSQTVSGLYMTAGDRIIFGYPADADPGNSGAARINLESISINVTELTDDFIIHDATSLDAFRGAIADAVDASESTDIDARVARSFSASSLASSWAPIDGYTGSLDGQDFTISGLTKPFFGNLQGTVENLTLNSTLNYTTDTGDYDGLGIFAQYLNGTMSHCTSKGSVTFCPSTAITNATRYVAGSVGRLRSGSMTNCDNQASVSYPDNEQTNDVVVVLGGTVASISSSTSSSYLTNSGTISVGVINSVDKTRNARIGGVVGYLESGGSPISHCVNTGAINYTGTVRGRLYIGGIVGSLYQAVSDCRNEGALTIGGEMTSTESNYYRAIGGIVGCSSTNGDVSIDITNCVNTSTATILNSGSATAYTVLGGIAGYCNGKIIGGSNAARVEYTGSSTNNVCVAGVVGRMSQDVTGTRINNVSNSGAVVVNTATSHASRSIFVSGISAHHQGGAILAHNSGPMSVTTLTCNHLYVGGLYGSGHSKYPGDVLAGSDNASTGTITVSGVTSSDVCCVGGLVGLGYGNVTGSSGVVTNAGSVTVTSSSLSGGTMDVGGLVGRLEGPTSPSNLLTTCINNGAVSNAASTTTDDVNVGGLVGYSNRPISASYNSATVTNTGSSGVDICMGGVVGNGSNITLTGCSNRNTVSNSGGGVVLAIGGLVGWSNTCTYSTVCYNSGAVSNAGTATNTDSGVRLGGLAGCITGANNLTGTSATYNYNSGAITESSASRVVNVGGVAGYINETGSQMNYVRNLGTGDITIQNNLRTRVGVGGIVGYAYHIFNFDYANNAGDINFSGLTISSQVFCGGILGAFHNDETKSGANDGVTQNAVLTINGCVNSGGILCPETAEEDGNNMGANSTSTTAYSYFGGISGVGNVFYKTFTNCSSSGEITVYNNLKSRVGGCLAYTNVNPTGCSCSGDIRYYKHNSPENNGSGQVGGVVAYINVSTISNLTYSGSSVYSRGASKTCYTGGIVGQIGTSGAGEGKVTTFSNCKVSGTIAGAGTGFNTSGPGIFAARSSSDSPWNFSFPDCIVKTGTKVKTNSTLTITADNVDAWVIGRYAPTTIAVSPTVGSWE